MKEYSFTDLILLVGTNPLPNFVVAEYFLRQNPALNKIWLIHSEENKDIHQKGTDELAENIRKLLQTRLSDREPERKLGFEFVTLENVSRGYEIVRSLDEHCIPALKTLDAIHVNYTGGTQVMGAHIYQAIQQEIASDTVSFSYLDAHTFTLIYDDERIPDSPDLRGFVSMNFEEMTQLHGYIRINRDSCENDVQFKPVFEVFKRSIDDETISSYFALDAGGYDRNVFLRKGGLAKKTAHVNWQGLTKISPKGVYSAVLNSLPDGFRLLDDGFFSNKGLQNNAACEYTLKFLDGGWLEDYIYDILCGSIPQEQAHVEKNWVIKKENWQGQSNFELDVILIKGYQLIGISCTTDERKGLCKHKGFEVILRSRQIGGAEAKAVLISRLPEHKRQELEQELQLYTGGEEMLMVLGVDDWKDDRLSEKIQTFLQDK